MKGYKIPMKGEISAGELPGIPFSKFLISIVVDAPPQGDTTEDLCRAALIYSRLEKETEKEFWWAGEKDFEFIKQRINKMTWGTPRSTNSIKTRLEIAAYVQLIRDLKEEEVPNT